MHVWTLQSEGVGEWGDNLDLFGESPKKGKDLSTVVETHA